MEDMEFKDFNDIVGHYQVIEYMRRVIKDDKVTHAYLFNGPDGTGKSVLAKLFAKTLQCREGLGDPCLKCRSCLQADSGNHPDIIFVKGEKEGIIGVDDIRKQVNEDIYIKPYSSRYKIYIIDNAEEMTPGAQNALLKTIEEPPEYGIVMLLANNKDKLLITVRSRCVTLNMQPLDDESIRSYLMERHGISADDARIAAAYGSGNLGRALEFSLNAGKREIQEKVLDMVRNIDSLYIYELKSAIKEISTYNVSLTDVLDMMLIWYRDLLMLKATGDIDLLNYRNEYSYFKDKARILSYSGLDSIIESIEKAKARLEANASPEIVLEMLLINIKENQNG